MEPDTLTNDDVRCAAASVLSAGRFFAAPPYRLRIEHNPPAAEPWEVFQGHLLGPQQTRNEAVLESFDVFLDGENTGQGPTLSIKFDRVQQQVHVVRGFAAWVFEPYEEAPNVILTRQRPGWTRELVGSVHLEVVHSREALIRLLERLVFLAVVGTSRLAITSLESPLSAYSLGWLHYLPTAAETTMGTTRGQPGSSDTSWTTPVALVDAAIQSVELPQVAAKTLEAALRAAQSDEVAELRQRLVTGWQAAGLAPEQLVAVLKDVFHGVALSPYTNFADNLVSLLRGLAGGDALGTVAVVDVISYFLRQLVRHLTAFDLESFHNQGSNYPDALLLDALLKAYLELIEAQPALFHDAATSGVQSPRLRRRALRQACLLRRRYENLAVPDAPTSPGESQRILPAPYAPVPEEQIWDRSSRRRRLFADEPTDALLSAYARAALAHSIDDLNDPRELRELGVALFLDRPLGAAKSPGAIDRTPLLSYEAYSRQIARTRLALLARWPLAGIGDRADELQQRLNDLDVVGFAAADLLEQPRPGVVSLEDAQRAALDFRIVRTTRRSRDALLRQYDLAPLRREAPELAGWLCTDPHVLLIRAAADTPSGPTVPRLVALDRRLQRRLEIAYVEGGEGEAAYLDVAGLQFLRGGLRVVRYWEQSGESGELIPRDRSAEAIRCMPRTDAAVDYS